MNHVKTYQEFKVIERKQAIAFSVTIKPKLLKKKSPGSKSNKSDSILICKQNCLIFGGQCFICYNLLVIQYQRFQS